MLTFRSAAGRRWLVVHASPAHQSRWEKDDAAQQSKDAVDGNADDAKREQHNPDERIEEKRQQRQRPAEHEQDAPEQEFHRTALYEAHP